MLKIDLTDLLREVGSEAEVTEEEKVNYPEDNLILTKPVKIKAHLVNTGVSVLLSGEAETEVELTCSRCLERYHQPLSFKIKEEHSSAPPMAKKAKEVELKEKDFVFGIEEDNTLDLSEIIRQNLLLVLPIKPLCKPDCKSK